jgi:hypothetical protein
MQIDINNLDFINKTLRTIVTEFEQESGIELTVTSLYRIDDKGVHGQLPLRGIDFRMRDARIGKIIEKQINDKWTYDPLRPYKRCAVFHNVGRGIHLHIQSHQNTVRN